MSSQDDFLRRRNERTFVIGPIGKENSPTRNRSDTIFDFLIKPAVELCGLPSPRRVDQSPAPIPITDEIVSELIECDLVIADLHGQNPNVFYELGIRHTTGKPCILLTEKGDQLPFDLNIHRTIFLPTYKKNFTPKSWEKAKADLVNQIRYIQKQWEPTDNLVTVAFEMLRLRRNQGLLDVFELMEPTRNTRRLIRSMVEKKRGWKDLTENELLQVDDLCRRFDLLGLYDRLGIVSTLHVDYIYSVPFVELYDDFLSDYVDHLRRGSRGLMHFWELVQFYNRVKHVPNNHPASTGGADWPENPRAPRK